MEEWEAGHDARASLQALTNEITQRRRNWNSVRNGWIDMKPVTEPISRTEIPTLQSYLNHVMAEDFATSEFPQKCLFKASHELMLAPSSNDLSKSNASKCSRLGYEVAVEKFSTDLAWLSESNHSAHNMTEFSRFLFQLSGETEMASAADPMRNAHSDNHFPYTSTTKHDRLIR
jgi:hypothetical protein